MILKQSLRPVALGATAGAGLAAALAAVLMSTPAASELGDSVHPLDPLAYIASLTAILAACVVATAIPTLRATRIDPIATLRED